MISTTCGAKNPGQLSYPIIMHFFSTSGVEMLILKASAPSMCTSMNPFVVRRLRYKPLDLLDGLASSYPYHWLADEISNPKKFTIKSPSPHQQTCNASHSFVGAVKERFEFLNVVDTLISNLQSWYPVLFSVMSGSRQQSNFVSS